MEKLVPKNKLFEWFIRVKSINSYLNTSIGTINRRCKSGNIFKGKYYLKFKEYAEKS